MEDNARASQNAQSRDRTRLNRFEMGVYAGPASVLAALGLPLSMYIPNHYVSNIGISATTAGLIFMSMRLWDVVSDPILGQISDQFQPGIGKRKFWLLLSIPVLVLSTIALFSPPASAGPAYLLMTLFALYIGWTMMQISHLAWSAELVSDYDDRSRLLGYRQISVAIGMFLVLAAPAILELGASSEQLPDIRRLSVSAMGWIIAILTPISVALAVILLPDKTGRSVARSGVHNGRLGYAGIKAILSNTALRRLIGADFLYRAGTGVTGTLFLWFVTFRLELGGSASLILVMYLFATIVAIPVWIELAKRLDRPRAFIISVIAPAILLVPLGFLDGGNPHFGRTLAIDLSIGPIQIANALNGDQLLGLTMIVLSGFTFGGAPFLARAIMTDVIDFDARTSGEKRSGLLFSMLTLTEKTGYAIAVGASLLALDAISFNPRTIAENSPGTLQALASIYALVPAGLFVASALLMRNFPISRDRS